VDYYGIDIAICVANETSVPSTAGKSDGMEMRCSSGTDGAGRCGPSRDVLYEHLDSVVAPKAIWIAYSLNPQTDARYTDFLCSVEANQNRCVFCKVGGPFIRTPFCAGQEAFLMEFSVGDEPFRPGHLGRTGRDH